MGRYLEGSAVEACYRFAGLNVPEANGVIAGGGQEVCLPHGIGDCCERCRRVPREPPHQVGCVLSVKGHPPVTDGTGPRVARTAASSLVPPSAETKLRTLTLSVLARQERDLT